MNTNQVDTTAHFFDIKYIIAYFKSVYPDTTYNYTYLRNKHGASLASSWFANSTWNMVGNFYQLQN